MEDYNKIIESLSVRFDKSKNIRILQPVRIDNYYDIKNSLIYLHKGEIRFREGDEFKSAFGEQMLFIPGGKPNSIIFGSGDPKSLSNDDFIENKELYFQSLETRDVKNLDAEVFTFVNFEAKIFDSVNFFGSLNIPPFVIEVNDTIKHLLEEISER